MAIEKHRIEEIQKRKRERERQNKRRIFILRRVLLCLLALLILVALVLGIKSCAGKVAEHRAQREAQIKAELEANATPTPTPEPVIDDNGINQTYYSNCAFLGNSFIDGLAVYGLIDDADYFSKVGLSVSQAMTDSMDMSDIPVVDELDNGKEYNKIFLMFGENEVGWVGNSFIEAYEELIEKVRSYQPNAKLYLLAITAISKNISNQDIDNLNIEAVKEYNKDIKALAKKMNVGYANIFKATVGKDGYLPAEVATDGVHFGEDYYIRCLKFIQKNCE
ncbi:MAG: hypothetical protein IJT23_04115 [Clostridia bacterium]|nr:hypothetical protein [Clostridia bacterium]